MLVDRLFAKLSSMYGARFADLWNGTNIDEVKATWSDSLSGFHVENIARAIKILTENNPFPPTLPEFISLCKQARMERGPQSQPALRLPEPVSTPEETEKARHQAFATARRLGLLRALSNATKAAA